MDTDRTWLFQFHDRKSRAWNRRLFVAPNNRQFQSLKLTSWNAPLSQTCCTIFGFVCDRKITIIRLRPNFDMQRHATF